MKISAALVSLIFISGNAFAFSTSQFISLPKAVKANTTLSCTDFSGTWVGTCETNLDGEIEQSEETLVISQDECTSITFDGNDTYEFGVAKTSTEADAENTSSVEVQPDWASSNTVIALTLKLSGKSLPANQFNYTYSGLMKGNFAIEEDQLVSKLAGKTVLEILDAGQTIESEQSTVCTYEKQ